MVHLCKGCGFHILSSIALCTRCAWSESLTAEKVSAFYRGQGWPVRRSRMQRAKKAAAAESMPAVTD